MCPANISRFKATMNGYIIFISTSTGCSSLCFPPYCYILPRKLLSWFLRQCRRAPVDTFNRYSDSRRSRRAKHVNKWLHSDNTELYNALTHFCVYCRVFSVASRVVAGYCRSFLQPLVAGGSWRESVCIYMYIYIYFVILLKLLIYNYFSSVGFSVKSSALQSIPLNPGKRQLTEPKLPLSRNNQ